MLTSFVGNFFRSPNTLARICEIDGTFCPPKRCDIFKVLLLHTETKRLLGSEEWLCITFGITHTFIEFVITSFNVELHLIGELRNNK